MRYETGIEFGGRYTLGDRIAVGGMGEVWRARDKVLARQVAIKLLSPTLAGQPGFAQRFREEARNTAALGHPNIASVYDYGEDAGAHWLVMELVEGQNLAQIIRDEGTIPPEQASSILAQAALGLQAAHDAGVIHRDIKPANIIIRRDGVVKLTDFGISRAIDAVPITRTGEVMGTAQYISPEQATGQSIGAASDVYSLGVVAYEMVTGQRPFDEASPVATAMAHVQEPPPPLPASVPDPLATVIMSCLAKSPADRPQSAGEVARILTGDASAANLLATQKLTTASATRMMPATAPRTAVSGTRPQPVAGQGGPVEQRRNLRWVWAVVAVVVVVGGIWAAVASGLFNGAANPTQTPTTTSTSDGAITIRASDYVGRQLSTVQADLANLNLLTNVTYENANAEAGTVTQVSNPGTHTRGDVIALVVSSGPSTPTTTQAPSTTSSEPTSSQPSNEPTASEPSTSDSNAGGNSGNRGDSGQGSADGGANADATRVSGQNRPADPATRGPAAPNEARSTENYLNESSDQVSSTAAALTIHTGND